MPSLNRVLLYVRDMEATANFYTGHFGFSQSRDSDGRIIELTDPDGGATLMIHQAGKGQKQGQAAIKLVFDVADVPNFVQDRAREGLTFGPIHQADGYAFANTKDPNGNSVSVSSRAFATPGD